MNLNRIAIISGVLVVLAGLVFGVSRWMGEPTVLERVGTPIMPSLDMSRAAAIEIVGHDKKVTLKSADGASWTVAEQDDFPVSAKKLNGLLIKLTQGKVAHQVTSKQEKLADLGLLTPDENGGKREEGKTGLDVRILDKDGKSLFAVMIGKERSGQNMSTFGGTYIRFPAESKAYLISEAAVIETDAHDWIDNTVLDVEGKTLQSIRIEKPGQPPLVLMRDKPDAEWGAEGLSAGQLNQEEAKSMANQLAGMDIFKVAPRDAKDADLGRKATGTVRFGLFDKRQFTIEVGMVKSGDDYRYLTVRAALPGDVQDEALKQKVETFNGRFQGRRLAVYDWDGGRLLRERKDFLPKQDK